MTEEISDAEIQEHYNQNQETYTTLETRKFDILRFEQPENPEDESIDFAQKSREILTLVKNDPDLDYKTYAESQDQIDFQETDWVTYNDAVDNISSEDLAMIINSSLSLKEGQQTDILQSRDGSVVYLAKIKGITEPKVKELDEVRTQIITVLTTQKRATT
ncbi:MAG: peptidylprolyl isomerase [Bdellovibrionota bacterium]